MTRTSGGAGIHDLQELPLVSVMITTNGRTDIACASVESLIRNTRYPKLNWIISDDRSENGHVERIVERFDSNNISNVTVCHTDNNHVGLGAALNNGLREAFKKSNVVLTTEDDWILQRPMDIRSMVVYLTTNRTLAAIRLGAMMNAAAVMRQRSGLYYDVVPDSMFGRSVFNNQVALRHSRVYKELGNYIENRDPDYVENEMNERFLTRSSLRVLWPAQMKCRTMDDKSLFFIHVGKSTVGHSRYKVPERYQYLYEKQNADSAKEQSVSKANDSVEKRRITKIGTEKPKSPDPEKHGTGKPNGIPCVTVVITTHNRTRVAEETVKHLCKNLKYGNLRYAISDDRSNAGHVDRLVETFRNCGIEDVKVLETDNERYGLGTALNNGLEYAWEESEFVLTVEDDWILERNLDLSPHVKMMLDDDTIGMIRLGIQNLSVRTRYRNGYDRVTSNGKDRIYAFTLQVALRRKMMFDKIGAFLENAKPQFVEESMLYRYNEYSRAHDDCRILIPTAIRSGVMDDKSLFFIHVGKSTIGNKYEIPERYRHLND